MIMDVSKDATHPEARKGENGLIDLRTMVERGKTTLLSSCGQLVMKYSEANGDAQFFSNC